MEQLLKDLSERGVRLGLDQGGLAVRAPKGALTEALRRAIAEHKEGLLRLLSARARHETLPPLVPRPDERHQPFPLLDVQHAYWLGRQTLVESGGVSTHLYEESQRAGLDVARLGTALQKVIERHDALRTVILADGTQRVLDLVPPYQMPVTDLRGMAPQAQQAGLQAVRERMSHQVLPADRWPLFEFHAVLLDGECVRICASVDMLILDGASLMLLTEEWARRYEDPAYAPPPLAVSFRDYVLAEVALRGHETYKRAEKYWLDRVETLPLAPDLPLARHPGELGTLRFTRHAAGLEAARWQPLKRRAQQAGVTPSAMLATAFAEVLRLWAKEPDFTLTLTLFNRLALHPQVDHLLGDFTAVSLLEMRALPGESFAARCRRVQQQLSRDLEHLHYSGVRVLRERARRLGSGPAAAMPIVFTSAMGLGEEGFDARSDALLGEDVYAISQTPQVWLDHQVREKAGALAFSWDVVDGVFPPRMAADMFAAYCALLERLADEPARWERAGGAAELPAWQARTLAEAQATQQDIPAATLHELVSAGARLQPGATAVIAADGCMSHAELQAHANRLGRQLRRRGAAKNTLVAVAMDKGWQQVAGVLGVLHAGAAYLPIDPQLPQQRRWQLLARGEARIVVTQAHLRHLPWPEGVVVVTLDDAEVAAEDAGTLPFLQLPQDTAYVIFTSGSTGEPKGVAIDHRGAANTVQDINLRYAVGPHDRVLALSALGFDLSVYDLFGVLAAGGAMVVPEARRQHDASHWSDLIETHGVTLWNSVPQLLQIWLEHRPAAGQGAGGSLRQVLLSGDWIPVRLPDALRAACPSARVASLGGATEASIWSIEYPIGEVDPAWKSIPYGKPLANQQVRVCNRLLEPRAVWAVGEIMIGGIGLAQGYWRDDARTAERFVVHPDSGERYYRTGDLGRMLPDGHIEFLGREDTQVKINGHRIELGEIEAALRRHPGVQDAVVKVVAAEAGQRQLAAYVVPQPGAPQALYEEEGVAASALLDARRAAVQDVLDLAPEEHRLARARALQAFDATWSAWERIAVDVVARTLSELGFFMQAGEQHTAAGIVHACGLDARRRPLLRCWLELLAQHGRLDAIGDGAFRSEAPFVREELEAQVVRQIAQLPPAERAPSSYLAQCAQSLAALLQGRRSALELLFADADAAHDQHESNPVVAMQNQVAAEVMRALVERMPPDARISVLEVGAGMGGTAASLLPELPPQRTRYAYTDVSSFFTEQGRQRFGDRPFVDYGLLDIDRDPHAQGWAPHAFDIIVATNTLHLARDLDRSLAFLRSLLAPAGVLLLNENLCNSPVQAFTVGLLDGFGHYDDVRRETELPLLSTAGWRQRLEAAGFVHVEASEPPPMLRSGFRQALLVAEAPPTVRRFRPERLRDALAQSLPAPMVPRHCIALERLPLGPNGKVDLKALPEPGVAPDTAAAPALAPRNDVEQRLHAVWTDLLGRDGFGIDANFFEIGGDSLIALSLVNRMRAEFDLAALDHAELIQQLFTRPTIAALAGFIARQDVSFEV